MILPAPSKALLAVLAYLIGVWAVNRALGGVWNGMAVIGMALVLYGVWYSTIRGRRDWGDVAFALATLLTIGQGVALLRLGIGGDPVVLIGQGHLYGIVGLALAWWPLRSQGLLPGGPERAA